MEYVRTRNHPQFQNCETLIHGFLSKFQTSRRHLFVSSTYGPDLLTIDAPRHMYLLHLVFFSSALNK